MGELSYILERLEAIDGKFDEKLDRILIQTTKTNGRVNGLEGRVNKIEPDINELKDRKNYNKGRERVLYVVIGSVGTLFLSLLAIYLK